MKLYIIHEARTGYSESIVIHEIFAYIKDYSNYIECQENSVKKSLKVYTFICKPFMIDDLVFTKDMFIKGVQNEIIITEKEIFYELRLEILKAIKFKRYDSQCKSFEILLLKETLQELEFRLELLYKGKNYKKHAYLEENKNESIS